jgi:hypothetical protein
MKMPAMVPVKSSNLQSVGFGNHGLFVRFSGGAVYRYPDAPKAVFDKLVQAESPGRAFQAEVRGKYAHQQHDE